MKKEEFISKLGSLSQKMEKVNEGNWVKFESRKANELEFTQNANKLGTFLKDTDWWTNTEKKAAKFLDEKEGEVYVFFDDNNFDARVAVYVKDGEILDIVGLQGEGDYHFDIENKYFQTVVNFLSKHKELTDAKIWAEKVKWDKRLDEWYNKLITGKIEDEYQKMFDDIDKKYCYRFGSHDDYYLRKLEETWHDKVTMRNIESRNYIRSIYAKAYKCAENDVYLNHYDDVDMLKTPKYIFGDYSTRFSDRKTISNLIKVDESFYAGKKLESLGSLRIVGKNVYLDNSQVSDLGDLEIIGNAINFNNLVKNFGKIRIIKGKAYIPIDNPVLSKKFEEEFTHDSKTKVYYRKPEYLKQSTNERRDTGRVE